MSLSKFRYLEALARIVFCAFCARNVMYVKILNNSNDSNLKLLWSA